MALINRIEQARRNGDELLTFDEALRFFRVSKPTLISALQRGEVVGFKIGRQWRVFKYPPKKGVEIGSDSVQNLIVTKAPEKR